MNKSQSYTIILLLALAIIDAKGQTTNYKTGIDVLFHGTEGIDYIEEYLFHDKLVDDHKVVYIKSNTPITMQHNANNLLFNNGSVITIGANGQDNTPNTGDEGTIRYRVDRELNYKGRYTPYTIKSDEYLPPAYTDTIRFNDLLYSDSVPVVGTTGNNGWPITEKNNFFTYGLLDSFGDEWHSFAFWDDDSWRSSSSYIENLASDGKIIQFVVNPKTPAIRFTPKDSLAQYYTTPPKIYFAPIIHHSTTYISGKVEIELFNITDSNSIFYRWDNNSFKQYGSPIATDSLSDGTHTLEYYYNNSYHRTRTIVKNPDYPSDQDIFEDGVGHGYLMWKNDAKYQQIRNRLLNGSLSSAYNSKRNTNSIYDGNGHNAINAAWHQGKRNDMPGLALLNAIVVAMEGAATCPTHADRAKKVLLDNYLALDILGAETKGSFAQIPYREREYRGYYDANRMYDISFAYDLMIKHYKATQFSGGITAIEDYKIRDLIASWNYEQMLSMGGYHYRSILTPTTNYNGGMWDAAKNSAAIIGAMAMPGYNTSYLGTSGFDGTNATHPYTPFPNHPASWEEVFITYTDKNNPLHVSKIYGYPDQQRIFNSFKGGVIDNGLITHDTILMERVLTNGDTVTVFPPGTWTDRVPYTDYHLMGHVHQIQANALKIRLKESCSAIEQLFDHANNGKLFGLKVNTPSDKDPVYRWQFLLVNENFPDHAAGAEAYLPFSPEQRFQYLTHPFGLIWYNPDWEDYLSYYTTDTLQICKGDSAFLQNGWRITQGIYIDTLTAANAADSIISTSLLINTVDTSIVFTNDSLIATAIASSYQWLDCNNGNSTISGETNQKFYPQQSGTYAVKITYNSCTDTSSCFFVIPSGIEKSNKEALLSIFPNPASSEVMIKLQSNESASVELINVLGQKMMSISFFSYEHTLDLKNIDPGTYYLNIHTSNKIYKKKLLVIGKL